MNRVLIALSIIFILFSCDDFSQKNNNKTAIIKSKPADLIDTTPYFMQNYNFERYGKGDFSFREVRGKVLLLSFWATWCGSCIKRHPEFEKISDNIHDNNFIIINISMDREIEQWEEYMSNHVWKGINLFVGMNEENPLGRMVTKSFIRNQDTLYRVGLPKYFILDKQLNLKPINKINYEKIENDIIKLLKT